MVFLLGGKKKVHFTIKCRAFYCHSKLLNFVWVISIPVCDDVVVDKPLLVIIISSRKIDVLVKREYDIPSLACWKLRLRIS
jgi:hypothetical protein